MGSFALFNSLNPERITAAAIGIGITEQLLRKSVKYAKERKVFKDDQLAVTMQSSIHWQR